MSQEQHAPGIFERHGTALSARAVSRVSRREATRAVMEYLAQNGLLAEGIGWEGLGEKDRDMWITALTDVYRDADRAAGKAAMAELRAREALAVREECPKCGAREGTPCWDMRTREKTHIGHPHQERMDEAEAGEG
jgi:hypothetical protein